MASVTLTNLRKVYPNGFEAVHDLDLEIGDGQLLALVGPSGCGKTTVLRMVAGLEDISGGAVRIGDRVVNDVSPKDRDIAMVFQNYALYPHMTVAENIAFALRLRKLSKKDVRRRVEEAARLLGLTPLLENKPGQLSGGQRQRVAMGRAIVREPSVFLMDEPLSNLDAKLRVELRSEVSRIQRRLGVATIYVTHDQTEAMTMGDQVAVMRGGLLQQLAAPQELYDQPSNMFVAEFIGSPSINLYEAELEEGSAAVNVGGQRLELPRSVVSARPALQAFIGRTVIVGIRPEDLLLDGESAGSGDTLAGRVELVESLGSEMLVHFSVDATRVHAKGAQAVAEEALTTDGELTRTDLSIARADPRSGVRSGEQVSFTVRAQHMQFFDGDSGASLVG
jgi:multiple sugar transport system ATP-binding protein